MTTPIQPAPAAPQQPQAPTTPAAPVPAQVVAPAPAAPAPAPVQPAPPAVPAWTPPPAMPAPAAPVDPGDDGSRDLSRLPQWAQQQITDLRREAAERRVAARTATVAQHAFAAAGSLGVNGHALLGSTAFQAAAAQLDPQAADFPAQLTAKIQEVMAANPWMAAQPAQPTTPAPITPPAPSGAEFAAGSQAGAPITEDQLAQMTPEQITQAFNEGRLTHLM